MSELTPGDVYLIELCSGEQRYWRFRGPDGQSRTWWQDVESGREFTEASLMYAWKVIGPVGRSPDSLRP